MNKALKREVRFWAVAVAIIGAYFAGSLDVSCFPIWIEVFKGAR